MRTLIITQDPQIKKIDVVDIHRLVIYPEERTGDGEYDRMNYWTLYAHLYIGMVIKLFEAKDFDNNAKFFYGHNAVKGKNYARVLEAKKRAEQAMVKANQEVTLIHLSE